MTVQPPSTGSGQAGYTNTITHNSLGQQVKSSDGFTTSLAAYDDKGEPFRSALDMDGDGEIGLAGTDRISESQSSYTTFGGKDVRKSG